MEVIEEFESEEDHDGIADEFIDDKIMLLVDLADGGHGELVHLVCPDVLAVEDPPSEDATEQASAA